MGNRGGSFQLKVQQGQDILGMALNDYYEGRCRNDLFLHTSYGELEKMPVEIFFRGWDDLSELEIFALSLCCGKVLDIGAGVGSHALILQQRGLRVDALEFSKRLVLIMKERGAEHVKNTDIFDYSEGPYDTLLLLMNGIGLAGSLRQLEILLEHLKHLVHDDGQLIFDSSDISYLYKGLRFPGNKYYGEIAYQYEYGGLKGDWFNWLYIDQDMLIKIADKTGWFAQIIYEDEKDQYLARLVLKKSIMEGNI